MVHRSTIFFALLALVLAGTTGGVTWLLLHPDATNIPQAGGSSFDLGLPDIGPKDEPRVLSSDSAILWSTSRQAILFEQNAFEKRPIASITKLMTAIVALDKGIDFNKPATIQPEEYVQGGRLLLHNGESVTVRDLWHASLLGSANNATLAYVRELGIPKDEFVQAMNRKAIEIGLEQTTFADVTGLDTDNISTAYEVARLAEFAFNHYPEIAAATSRTDYSFVVGGSGREHTIRNTNKLVAAGTEQVSGSKTGYLYEARYCLVMQGAGEMGDRIAVVLSSPSEPDNLAEIKKLLHLDVP